MLTVRRLVLGALLAAGCGSPASHSRGIDARTIPEHDTRGTSVRAEVDAGSPLPGCPAAAARTTRDDLAAFAERLKVGGAGDPVASLLAALRTTLTSPCLAHVAASVDLDALATIGELRDLWRRGFGDALVMDAGGIGTRNGKRVWAVPPEPSPMLAGAARSALAPWSCTALDATCAASADHVARAEAAFAHLAADPETAPHLPSCVPSATAGSREGGPTAWQAWVSCVTDAAPRSARYPTASRFRVPEQGWLIVSGRRGHYEFTDEVHAFDLATGAGYVASTAGALALTTRSGGSARRPGATKTAAGRIETDRARELAFALVTARAVTSIRVHAWYVEVPIGLQLDTGAADEQWGSGHLALRGDSSHTTLRWVLVDHATVRAAGELEWPRSMEPAEDHANDLLAAVEASFAPGCVPAAPPAELVLDPGLHPPRCR